MVLNTQKVLYDGAVSIEPSFTQFSNKPIIIKDKYEVSGSDASQIGWVEVTTEGGDSGYLWYLKGEGETRLRFEDYLEMAVVEGEKKSGNGDVPTGIEGTEGLFAAVTVEDKLIRIRRKLSIF